MARHAEVPAPTDPGVRTKRTGLATALGTLIVIVLVLPEAIDIVDAELGEHLPPAFRAWLLGAAAVTTAATLTITRIMALPRVNAWLSRFTPFGTVRPAEARRIEP